jgi:hypothetical protein
MSQTRHMKSCFTGTENVRDIVTGRFTGAPPVRRAIQTVPIGGLAAGAVFLIARAIS